MLLQGMRSWLTTRGARVGLLHVLAALVLFTQQFGLQHRVQHERSDEGTVAHSVCPLCLAFHAADDAVPSEPITWTGAQASHALACHSGRSQCSVTVVTGFQPRAPPSHLS
jgi:hypothetical protein